MSEADEARAALAEVVALGGRPSERERELGEAVAREIARRRARAIARADEGEEAP